MCKILFRRQIMTTSLHSQAVGLFRISYLNSIGFCDNFTLSPKDLSPPLPAPHTQLRYFSLHIPVIVLFVYLESRKAKCGKYSVINNCVFSTKPRQQNRLSRKLCRIFAIWPKNSPVLWGSGFGPVHPHGFWSAGSGSRSRRVTMTH